MCSVCSCASAMAVARLIESIHGSSDVVSLVALSDVVGVVASAVVLEVVRLRVEPTMSRSIRRCTVLSLVVVAFVVVQLAHP